MLHTLMRYSPARRVAGWLAARGVASDVLDEAVSAELTAKLRQPN